MKSSSSLLLAVLLLLAATPSAVAAEFGVRAGRYNDGGQEFVGAEYKVDLGAVNLNPNVEYHLDDEVTAGSANLDLTYDITTIGILTPYVGLGAGLGYVDDEIGGAETTLLANALGGVTFNLEFLNPYAQVRYSRALEGDGDDDNVALMIGLRF